MKKLLIGLCLLSLIGGAAGCASWTTTPSVCDNPPSKSYLCDIANKYDIRIETIGATLVAVNAANIGMFELYDKKDALRVMTEIRSALDGPISYAFFALEIEKKLYQYPGLLDVAEDILHELDKLLDPIAAFDRQMLIDWLDGQIENLEDRE